MTGVGGRRCLEKAPTEQVGPPGRGRRLCDLETIAHGSGVFDREIEGPTTLPGAGTNATRGADHRCSAAARRTVERHVLMLVGEIGQKGEIGIGRDGALDGRRCGTESGCFGAEHIFQVITLDEEAQKLVAYGEDRGTRELLGRGLEKPCQSPLDVGPATAPVLSLVGRDEGDGERLGDIDLLDDVEAEGDPLAAADRTRRSRGDRRMGRRPGRAADDATDVRGGVLVGVRGDPPILGPTRLWSGERRDSCPRGEDIRCWMPAESSSTGVLGYSTPRSVSHSPKRSWKTIGGISRRARVHAARAAAARPGASPGSR